MLFSGGAGLSPIPRAYHRSEVKLVENKTKPSTADVAAFLSGVDLNRQADCQTLNEIMGRITGERPVLWATMVGFGSYHYIYESGRQGDSFLVGYAPRKGAFSLYLSGCTDPADAARRQVLLGRFGKYRMGKACIYVKRLADIDLQILEDLVAMSVETTRRMYPQL